MANNSQTAEAKKAREAVAVILEQADPFAMMQEICKASDLPPTTTRALIKRMRTRYQHVNAGVKQLTHTELVGKIDEKISLALDHMDEFTFSGANLRDLAIVLGILIEKKQLLNHQPTQIISMEERKHIDELMPMMMEIAQRRGITIDVTPGEPARALPREVVAERDVSASERRMDRHREDGEIDLG